MSLIPGVRRSPGGGNGNPLQILAQRIPWTEEPGAHPTKHAHTQLTLEQWRGLSAYMSSKSAVPLHP